jgi:hypothetical protein
MPATLVDTAFPFIKISNDDSINPYFPLTVAEALNQIASKSVGKTLLRGISNSKVAPDPTGDFKVKITRANSSIHVVIGSPGLEGGSKAMGFNEDAAKSGAGCKASCVWNPNIFNTPNGGRPPFIGLAHELIHCYHMVTGTMKQGYDAEEEFTVGIGPYTDNWITENKIRAEHNVPLRTQY